MSERSSPEATTDDNKKLNLNLNAVQLPKPVQDDPAESARLCNEWVDSALTKNTAIQFLLKTLIDSGCNPPPDFIRCMECKHPAAGGFGMVVEEEVNHTVNNHLPSNTKEQCNRSIRDLQDQLKREKSGQTKLSLNPEIYVCQQYMENEKMTHKTVHHELIHAIDMCRTNMDPLRNCIHMACTEIRAENLSGECSFWKELPRMSSFRAHGKECVKRRAILSVRANPNCTSRAEDYVDAAMNRCYMDFYPYDKHPNQK
jgi:mitochondrial inner membrane protease ATP23